MNDPIITLRNVSKRFGQTRALDNVSLEIPEGVVFALLGENGAGKSTLIRILTGYLAPDQGEATVFGQSCGASGLEIRRRIGYVSDTPALYEWMTTDEIGWFAAGFYEEGFLARFRELVTEFDLPLDARIKHLSKGQQAKVSLALATAHEPKALILDEPTSGLDPIVRRHFLESMVDHAAQGRTVLLSSHQINEVERVADWVGFLHQGELKLVKPLQELRDMVSIVTIASTEQEGNVPPPPGSVMSETRHGRQWRWVMQDLPDDWRNAYTGVSGVTEMDTQAATLEEIFVAVCDRRTATPVTTSPR